MGLLRSVATLCASLACLVGHAQVDTVRFASLDRNVDAYIAAIEDQSIATKIEEADFMIGSCEEDDIRNHVAIRLYDHYLNSKLMGDESVAVHLTDSWFSPGKTSFTNDIDLMNARIYAEFNRRSLIGVHAPSLRLRTPEDKVVEALGVVSDTLAGRSGRLRVLFLYDTDCTRCQVETIMLRAMFRQTDYPIDFLAVYTGSNRESWDKYRNEYFGTSSGRMQIYNYWDPEIDSDFQRKYGVLQTPRMLLIGKDGTILGRNLDTQALMSLLEIYSVEPELEYGSEESIRMFSALLPESDRSMTADSVRSVADYITSRTLAVGDTLNFKQLTGDLLYYLSGRRGEAFRYGSDYVSGTMVLDRPDIWNSSDDSLKVIGLASMVRDLIGKAPVGSRLPDIKVHGTLLSRKGLEPGVWRLSALKQGTYVLFHTRGCEVCAAEIEAAGRMVSDRRFRILLVDMDEQYSRADAEMENLLDAFDLSVLPFEFEVGRKGTMARKYTTLVDK